jgi:hypothetical protein
MRRSGPRPAGAVVVASVLLACLWGGVGAQGGAIELTGRTFEHQTQAATGQTTGHWWAGAGGRPGAIGGRRGGQGARVARPHARRQAQRQQQRAPRARRALRTTRPIRRGRADAPAPDLPAVRCRRCVLFADGGDAGAAGAAWDALAEEDPSLADHPTALFAKVQRRRGRQERRGQQLR